MSKLIIHRTNAWINRLMEFNLFLNDKFIGVISNKETITCELEKCEYNLKEKAGLILKSQELSFSINDNEEKYFELGSFGQGYFKTFLKFEEIN